MILSHRLALAVLGILAVIVGSAFGYVGVRMQGGAGEFNLGSAVQWASIAIICLGLTFILCAIIGALGQWRRDP